VLNSSLLLLTYFAERFWGWTENKREVDMDLAELSQRAQEGKPLYGKSDQPEWVQGVAHKNSVFSQLKFCAWFPRDERLFFLTRFVFCSRVPDVSLKIDFPLLWFFKYYYRFNLVNHPYHGTDPAKYGAKSESASEE